MFRIEATAWLLVGFGGGTLVALFEVAYQFGIAGAGVAGAAALLYLAPVLVALPAKPLLRAPLTASRILLALVVMAGGGPPRTARRPRPGARPPPPPRPPPWGGGRRS